MANAIFFYLFTFIVFPHFGYIRNATNSSAISEQLLRSKQQQTKNDKHILQTNKDRQRQRMLFFPPNSEILILLSGVVSMFFSSVCKILRFIFDFTFFACFIFRDSFSYNSRRKSIGTSVFTRVHILCFISIVYIICNFVFIFKRGVGSIVIIDFHFEFRPFALIKSTQ